MDETISEDGEWRWDGYEWVPNQVRSVKLSDSAVTGDVIASQQNIQQSVDADVIKAAMEGVVGAIKELHPIHGANQDPAPSTQSVSNHVPYHEGEYDYYGTSDDSYVGKSKAPKMILGIFVALLVIAATTITVLSFWEKEDGAYGSEEVTNPILGRWYSEGPPENSYISFMSGTSESKGLSGPFYAGEDNDRDGVVTDDEKEIKGTWTSEGLQETGIVNLTFYVKESNEEGGIWWSEETQELIMRYHINLNLLAAEDLDNDGDCDWTLVRDGFQQTEESMQNEINAATPPSFCTLEPVDW